VSGTIGLLLVVVAAVVVVAAIIVLRRRAAEIAVRAQAQYPDPVE
jgi:hypothetical protein